MGSLIWAQDFLEAGRKRKKDQRKSWFSSRKLEKAKILLSTLSGLQLYTTYSKVLEVVQLNFSAI